MKHEISEQELDQIRCTYCRNLLVNRERIVKDYKGDFISCWCKECSDNYEQNNRLGPKFLVCTCTPGQPKELDFEMAKSEIEAQAKTAITDECCSNVPVETVLDRVKKLGLVGELYKDKEFDEESEPEHVSKLQKKRNRNTSVR